MTAAAVTTQPVPVNPYDLILGGAAAAPAGSTIVLDYADLAHRPEELLAASAQAVAELSPTRQPPRIVLAVEPWAEPAARRWVEAGLADDYLPSPVTADDLAKLPAPVLTNPPKVVRQPATTSKPAPTAQTQPDTLPSTLLNLLATHGPAAWDHLPAALAPHLPVGLTAAGTVGGGLQLAIELAHGKSVRFYCANPANLPAAAAWLAERQVALTAFAKAAGRLADLSRLVTADARTGLANAAYFRHLLLQATSRAVASRQTLHLVALPDGASPEAVTNRLPTGAKAIAGHLTETRTAVAIWQMERAALDRVLTPIGKVVVATFPFDAATAEALIQRVSGWGGHCPPGTPIS